VKIKPDYAGAWSNMGAAYHSQANYLDAKRCYLKSFEFSKDVRDAYNNYANVAQCLGDRKEALRYYQKALEVDPAYIEPKYSLAEMALQVGDFKKGWIDYELRKIKRESDVRHFNHPTWTGQKLTTEKLLVFSEQGIGDVVMFGTILPDLLQDCPNIVLEVDHRMVDLFARSFPQIEVMPRSMRFIEGMTVKIPGVDLQISIADLAQHYRQSFTDFPQNAYLQADPNKRALWKQRFAELGSGLKVGISWRGGKDVDVGTRRSAKLEIWKDLFEIPGINFINLQYGDCREDIAWVKNNTSSTLHDWPECDPKLDLETFAAQIQELDLVLSIDNATVHFAGGLGAKTIVMLSALPDWRWGLDQANSYWYPGLKLIRQQEQFQWKPVFDRVYDELIHLTSQKQLEAEKLTSPPAIKPEFKSTPQKHKCAIIAVTPESLNKYTDENMQLLKQTLSTKQSHFAEFIPLRVMVPNHIPNMARGYNFGCHQANEFGCEWTLFLPPRSRIVPNLFDVITPYLNNYDAIWGEIYTYNQDVSDAIRLADQMPATADQQTFFAADPARALGHMFLIRSKVGLKIDWKESFGSASDYEGFARLWKNHRCIKLDQPLSADYAPNGLLQHPNWSQSASLVIQSMQQHCAKAS
jgi:tetratricopeptide (TPR) repeat protein